MYYETIIKVKIISNHPQNFFRSLCNPSLCTSLPPPSWKIVYLLYITVSEFAFYRIYYK